MYINDKERKRESFQRYTAVYLAFIPGEFIKTRKTMKTNKL